MKALSIAKTIFFCLSVLPAAFPAGAAEPAGCRKFKWPLDHERALLARSVRRVSGSELADPFVATQLALPPLSQANLPMPPSRPPKFPQSHAGFARIATLRKAGIYRVTLSRPAWIDVVQDKRELKSIAFTGAKDCADIAKSVKFRLTATPLVIELSGTSADSIAFVITPD